MKKTLVLFPLLLSLTAFANHDADVQTGTNFVEKSFTASHHKCQKVQSDVESYGEKLAHWEVVKEDCLILDQMMALRAAKAADKIPSELASEAPTIEVLPEAPAADLPKDEI